VAEVDLPAFALPPRHHTAGGEAVKVELDLDVDGRWRNLWLSGLVRRLVIVSPAL
jgi:hypothetical protein